MNEEQAKKILGNTILPDGSLSEPGSQYVFWKPGDPEVTLDGAFTADDLEAITWCVRHAPTARAPTE